jgi:hypothetical protein
MVTRNSRKKLSEILRILGAAGQSSQITCSAF